MNSQTNQMFVAQSVNGPFSIDAKAYLTSKVRKVTLNDEITDDLGIITGILKPVIAEYEKFNDDKHFKF